jgi:hypothetical protein
MDQQDSHARERTQIDRRTVVRAGVWTVPVIAVATTAPALAAASAGHQLLIFNNFTVNGADYASGKPTTIETNFSLRTQWMANAPALTGITVQVSFPDSRVTGGPATIVTGSGWTVATPSHSGSSWTYTLLWSGSLPNASSTPGVYVRAPLVGGVSGAFDVTGIASAPGATSATATATAHL